MASTKILCVDDDVDDRNLLSDTIKHIAPEVEVVEVQNGLEALTYLKNATGENDLPFLVMLDLNMPYLDGKKTLEKIRSEQRFEKLPVVIYTSGANPNDRAFFNKQGVEMLVKPFRESHLKQIVEDLLTNYR